MMKILYDVETHMLLRGDIIIRNDEAQVFVGAGDVDPETHYQRVTWAEQIGSRVTWETTAQPWNTWPIVVRAI